jgi:hypothetical protein
LEVLEDRPASDPPGEGGPPGLEVADEDGEGVLAVSCGVDVAAAAAASANRQ